MKRVLTALLVTAVAGVAGWWAAQRAGAQTGGTSRLALGGDASRPVGPGAEIDPKMIIVPRGDIDPKMVRTIPEVDPKMPVEPQALPGDDANVVITPVSVSGGERKMGSARSGGYESPNGSQPNSDGQ